MRKDVIRLILVCIAILFTILLVIYDTVKLPISTSTVKPTLIPVVKPTLIPTQDSQYIVSVTIGDLEQDLISNYSHLSTNQRQVLLDAIMNASNTYNVSPLVLYSIASVESSFRPWITHSQIKIKGKYDNAIGLTGVVFSWWGKALKEKHILETKSDLYNPTVNITACAFIFNNMKNQPLKKGTNNPSESAMRRYFGGNFKSYSDKIKAKMGSIIFKKIYK